MARVRTSGSLSRAGRPVFGCSEVWLSFHQSSTSTYNETKKESRSTMRHHPLERVWCISIRSGLLLRWPELHITRLRSSPPASNAQVTAKIAHLSDTPASIEEYGANVTDKGTLWGQPIHPTPIRRSHKQARDGPKPNFSEHRHGEVVRRISLLRASVHSLLLELLRIDRYHSYLRLWVPPSALRVAENRPHGRPDGS